jgi:putative PIN family toxin of toxin-antitoxin system
LKVVLDSNVILAALGTRGLCEAVMGLSLEQHEVALSEPILAEVAKHLAGKFKVPAARVREIEGFLREHATIVDPVDVPASDCRDPDDCAILGTAIAAAAHCLVTGDKDLLDLKQYHAIKILSPRDFYELIRG